MMGLSIIRLEMSVCCQENLLIKFRRFVKIQLLGLDMSGGIRNVERMEVQLKRMFIVQYLVSSLVSFSHKYKMKNFSLS